MGERLAKEVEAVFRARFEQLESWNAVLRTGTLTLGELTPFMVDMTTLLRDMIIYLARQVDDPPGPNEPQP